MANSLDEMNEVIREEGRDINVIAKQLPVKASVTDIMMVYGIAVAGIAIIILGILIKNYIFAAIGLLLIIYVIFSCKNADAYFRQLEQKIQQQASQIDNYLENRVIILQNTAKLVEKGINLDKELLSEIAKLRSGNKDINRNELNSNLDNISRQINIAVENYPDIKAHAEIRDAIQQNSYLQREITAARDLYNDVVYAWNREVFSWPFKKFIAAKRGLTTRIPFIASKETKERAREVFF